MRGRGRHDIHCDISHAPKSLVGLVIRCDYCSHCACICGRTIELRSIYRWKIDILEVGNV
jgi:hypothetical protein